MLLLIGQGFLGASYPRKESTRSGAMPDSKLLWSEVGKRLQRASRGGAGGCCGSDWLRDGVSCSIHLLSSPSSTQIQDEGLFSMMSGRKKTLS